MTVFDGGAENPLARALPPVIALPLARVPGLDLALELLFAETDRVRCGHRLLADRLFEVVVLQFAVSIGLGIAVIVNRAFDDGRLFARSKYMPLPGWAGELQVGSWAQLFLRFALSHPAVTVVIPATGKPERQADNLKGGIGPLLSDAQQAELVRLFA